MNVLYLSRRFLHNKLIVGILVAIGVVSIAVPVYAHYIYEDGYTYSSSYDCAWNRAEISHGSGGGYSKSDITAKLKGSGINCFVNFSRPINHLRAAYDLNKWNGSSWGLCGYTNWTYNTGDAYKLVVFTDHGATPVCGDGSYQTIGYGEFKNGTWKGGAISSGGTGHVLPP